MRMVIKKDDLGCVRISYDDSEGNRLHRRFWCQKDGGYVYEYTAKECKQAFKKLSFTGSTLVAKSKEHLLTLIKKEYKSMKRSEANTFK